MEKDILDQASELSESLRDAGVAAVRSLVPAEKVELTEEDMICEVCGSDIPQARAKFYNICVDCKQDMERNSRRTRVCYDD